MVAITGMGICCAAGLSVGAVWETLTARRVPCSQAPADMFAPHPSSPLFTVAEKDPAARLSSSFLSALQHDHLTGLDRTTALALLAISQALHQAGITPRELAGRRLGIALGTTVSCTFRNQSYYRGWKEGREQPPDAVIAFLDTNIAARLHAILGSEGPRAVVASACTSATEALGLGKTWLEQDLCDMVLAGGCDELSRFACHGFSSLMLLSPHPCRPFDRDRSGLNIGEGAGIFFLEHETSAAGRKIARQGRMRGYGSACDAYHPTAPHPQARGLQQALALALRDSGLALDEIDYINAHGTGTRANDGAELAALHHLGLNSKRHTAISSSKGATGHALGAAGGVEAVITMLCLQHGLALGTIGCRHPDPDLPLEILAEKDEQQLGGNLGCSLSLAFGGGNAALILEGERQ